ncbi:hypothetical protein EDC01DRAFT_783114 [Geopyxis carbonaria]|nr:hypothetical protein EDC01DRAFT_783114 [Geopyxis carbonaria]
MFLQPLLVAAIGFIGSIDAAKSPDFILQATDITNITATAPVPLEFLTLPDGFLYATSTGVIPFSHPYLVLHHMQSNKKAKDVPDNSLAQGFCNAFPSAPPTGGMAKAGKLIQAEYSEHWCCRTSKVACQNLFKAHGIKANVCGMERGNCVPCWWYGKALELLGEKCERNGGKGELKYGSGHVEVRGSKA